MSLNKVDALYLFVNDNILLRGGKQNKKTNNNLIQFQLG